MQSVYFDNMIVGVLALQGAFVEHIRYFHDAVKEGKLTHYGIKFVEVKTVEQLRKCHALVIPGGESTSISYIAERTGLLGELRDFCSRKPVWGTCAGLIFLSNQIENGNPGQKCLGGLDISVVRNAFGRQSDLFQQSCNFSLFARGLSHFRAVFIRAPVVNEINVLQPSREVVGPATLSANGITVNFAAASEEPVKVLYALKGGLVVAVRQGKTLGTSFHPELSGDSSFHGWFLKEFVIPGARIPAQCQSQTWQVE